MNYLVVLPEEGKNLPDKIYQVEFQHLSGNNLHVYQVKFERLKMYVR